MARKHSPKAVARVRHPLKLLNTGVAGLDEVLGGGVPALSFNLIAGSPGSGKTTLAMQILFAASTPQRPGLFITLLGETALKMLRYQQLGTFFDRSQVGSEVHFLNLSEEALAPAATPRLDRAGNIGTRNGASEWNYVPGESCQAGRPARDCVDPILERLTQLHYVNRKGVRVNGDGRRHDL